MEQLETTDRTEKSIDLQKIVTRALSLPSISCVLSKWSVSVTPPPFRHVRLHTQLYTARTLIKCYLQLLLLTLQQDKATCGPLAAI